LNQIEGNKNENGLRGLSFFHERKREKGGKHTMGELIVYLDKSMMNHNY
jgi:hypothetical protein